MGENEFVKILLDMFKSMLVQVLDGMKGVQDNVSSMAVQVDRIADLAKAEPTRQSLKDFVRDSVGNMREEFLKTIEEHDETCSGRHATTMEADEDNAKTVLTEAIEALDAKLAAFGDVKKLGDDLKTVKKILWFISVICVPSFLYFLYLYHNTNGLLKVLEAAYKAVPK